MQLKLIISAEKELLYFLVVIRRLAVSLKLKLKFSLTRLYRPLNCSWWDLYTTNFFPKFFRTFPF